MIRPDGVLSHDPDPADQPPRDACGVFGVWAPGEDVAKLTYYGLYSLQHRGQESAGIAVSDGSRIVVYKDMGLVAQVFNESVLNTLQGHVAVGHCRYSTSGSSVWENAQPTFRATPFASLALGHNGNLINTLELASLLGHDGTGHDGRATSDTDVLTALFAANGHRAGGAERPGVEAAARSVLPLVRELVAIDDQGVRSHTFAPAAPKGCLFEYVYLARPDTAIAGRSVQAARVEVGRRLAAEYPADADLVIPVPESSTPAAIGYAQASGIPYGQGLVKNSYVGRTFIQPSQTIRERGIRLKYNPLRDVIVGKRLVVVDDSIVRGSTQRAIVAMLREAGAAEVHVRISSPPVAWPCFFGIDFASREELMADNLTIDEMRESIGADSLGFVSLAALTEATTIPAERLCRACFDGKYPVAVAEDEKGKHLLELAGSRGQGRR